MQTTGTTIVESSLPPISAATPRLSELVVHLTDCNPRLAIGAVAAAIGATDPAAGDRLAIVAGALVSVRRSIDLRDPRPVAKATE